MEEENVNTAVVEEQQGVLFQSLKRNAKKIREDRAQAIGEDAQMVFKRKVEDLQLELKRLQRNRDNMLDMSAEQTTSLIIADKFDPNEFTDEFMRYEVAIRNKGIEVELAEKAYTRLFGGAV